MTRRGHLLATLFGAALFGLSACGGNVGPGEKPLIGAWEQDGIINAGAPGQGVSIENARVVYNKDGSSTYNAELVISQAGTPQDLSRFRLDADVDWVLEETVLTRTLGEMRVSPTADTEQAREAAAAYQQGLAGSPPAVFIVQSVDKSALELLDPDTGETLRFRRAR